MRRIRYCVVGVVGVLWQLLPFTLADEAVKSAPPTFDWVNLPGVDGKAHSLDDIKTRFVVVAFIANHCSLCQFQSTELNRIQMEYGDRNVNVVAISVSKSPDDRLPQMIERAKSEDYKFLWLHDASQNTARRLQVTRIPTIALLNQERRVVYFGALNDDGAPIKNHYLRAALDASIEGRPIAVPKTKSFGCGIQYE